MERIKGRQVAVDFVNAVKVDQEPEQKVDLNDMADMQIKADEEEVPYSSVCSVVVVVKLEIVFNFVNVC